MLFHFESVHKTVETSRFATSLDHTSQPVSTSSQLLLCFEQIISTLLAFIYILVLYIDRKG